MASGVRYICSSFCFATDVVAISVTCVDSGPNHIDSCLVLWQTTELIFRNGQCWIDCRSNKRQVVRLCLVVLLKWGGQAVLDGKVVIVIVGTREYSLSFDRPHPLPPRPFMVVDHLQKSCTFSHFIHPEGEVHLGPTPTNGDVSYS